ncbi:TPA: hypothetical protein HA241_00120 [Candidatus Woesearchaeota archaeon]|nr:hypothetical protein [Candidatus Woesearchaeota archaeon]
MTSLLEQTVTQEITHYAHSSITAAIMGIINADQNLDLSGKDNPHHPSDSMEQEQPDLELLGLKSSLSISYSFHRDQFLSSSYSSISGPVDHIEMMYGEIARSSFSSDEEYLTGSPQVEEDLAETMTAEEAQEAVRNVQYATALGTFHDVSPRERQRLSTYGLFNTVSLMLNHTLHALTADVDYSRTI